MKCRVTNNNVSSRWYICTLILSTATSVCNTRTPIKPERYQTSRARAYMWPFAVRMGLRLLGADQSRMRLGGE
jgi:hypothetical protein